MVEAILGVLPDGWNYTTLGKACGDGGGGVQTGPFGSQLHASDYVDEGIPSIMPANIGDNRIVEAGIARINEEDAIRLARYRVRAGDIVYSRRGDVERRALVRPHEDGWLCGTGCLRIRLGEHGHDPVFTSYYLGHPKVRQWIVRHAQGATMANLNTTILSNLPFLEAPKQTQSSIAKILGDLDDEIDLLREMNRTLEDIARTLFRAWFIDFLPVHAKAAGAPRFSGMPQELFDSLPDRFESSEIGEIPNGWEEGSVGDVVQMLRESVKPFERPTELFEHFSLPAFDREQEPELAEGATIKSAKFSIPEGAILFSKLNPRIPRIWLPRPVKGDVLQIASTEFLVCLPKEGWFRSYAFGLVSQSKFIEDLVKKATGTSNSHQRIKPSLFEQVAISLPPCNLRLAFDKVVGPLIRLSIANREKLTTLSSLRDTILPNLVSGELEAPSLEALGISERT